MARIIILLLFAITAQAVDFRWTVSSQNTETNKISLYQGETLRISVMLQSYSQGISTNGTSAEFLYRTNSVMGWWTIPASVTNGRVLAVFSPTNDVGALRYEWFIRFQDDGLNYRCTGIINMIPSPGFVPNELPRQVYRIDFDAIEYLNAPWTTIVDIESAQSNTLSAAEAMIQEAYSNAVAVAYAEGWLSYTNSTTYSAILASNIAASVAHSATQYTDEAIGLIATPTRIYNPSNAEQWFELQDNIMHIYSVEHTNTLWTYHCGDNAVPDYPSVQWAPYPQDGIFTNPPPPFASIGEIITPMVGNSGGNFRFWWSSGYYMLAYPNDFPSVGATWDGTTLQGNSVDVSIRWLGANAMITNHTRLVLATTNNISAHNADTNAHAFILGQIAQRPDYAALAWVADAATNYTRQYIVEVIADAELANIPMVQLLIGDHNTNKTAHADLRASITNLPAQTLFKLHNLYSTNVNSQLFIAASNGMIYVQEVLP